MSTIYDIMEKSINFDKTENRDIEEILNIISRAPSDINEAIKFVIDNVDSEFLDLDKLKQDIDYILSSRNNSIYIDLHSVMAVNDKFIKFELMRINKSRGYISNLERELINQRVKEAVDNAAGIQEDEEIRNLRITEAKEDKTLNFGEVGIPKYWSTRLNKTKESDNNEFKCTSLRQMSAPVSQQFVKDFRPKNRQVDEYGCGTLEKRLNSKKESIEEFNCRLHNLKLLEEVTLSPSSAMMSAPIAEQYIEEPNRNQFSRQRFFADFVNENCISSKKLSERNLRDLNLDFLINFFKKHDIDEFKKYVNSC